MKKHLLVVGIIFLFLISAMIPVSLGYDIEVPEVIDKKSNNSIYGNPPEEEWNKTYGGMMHDNAYSILQASDGGYLIIGYTNSFDYRWGDVWLIKTDSEGNEQWNKTYDGIGGMDVGTNILKTSDGGYIITGKLTDGPPPPLDFIVDAWLIKIDHNFTEQWNKTFGGDEHDSFYSIQQTNDDGYIILGDTDSYGAGRCDIWLVKTDINGNKQWNKTFGDNWNEHGKSLLLTNDGGFIIVGSKQKNIEPYDIDIWLVKTDENGNMLWNKTFGGSNWDRGYSILEIDDNGYFLLGRSGPFQGNNDLWLIKTDINGNEQWNETFGGDGDDSGESIIETMNGDYIIVGFTSSFGAGGRDVWLIKINENGTKLWDKTFGGKNSDGAGSVIQISDGGFIITGYTDSYGPDSSNAWLIKVAKENHPPSNPIINGPTHGKVGVEYTYTFNSTHPSGYNITYYVSWGDGSPNESLGPVPPGVEVEATHTWNNKGTYVIRAKAREYDEHTESGWGELQVTMPRDKAVTSNVLLLRLLERFPLLQRVLDLWRDRVE